MARILVSFTFLFLLFSTKLYCQPLKSSSDAFWTSSQSFRLLPQNFYTEHLTFFCRNEVAWQRKLPFRLFVRLGSKEMADRLEGNILLPPNRISTFNFFNGKFYGDDVPAHQHPGTLKGVTPVRAGTGGQQVMINEPEAGHLKKSKSRENDDQCTG